MTDHKKIIENYINAYNNFDIDGMLAELHTDICFENIHGDETTLTTQGISEFEEQAGKATRIFTEREQVVNSFQTHGNQTIVSISYTGILACDLPNGLKKGDIIKLNGKSVFTFREGKIIHLRDES
ncbi:nuclear transport factor 2 family protein [Sinomicrobium sp. M5D2P9]